jgi:hypothetical protein
VVPYLRNCSRAATANVKVLLGDTSSSSASSTYAGSISYSQAMDSTVDAMVAYSLSLDAYNAEYIANKTRNMPNLSPQAIGATVQPLIRSINTSFADVLSAVDNAIACMALTNETVGCRGVVASQYELYVTLRDDVNSQLYAVSSIFDQVQSQFEDYKGQVVSAITAADAFYQSVVGVEGIIVYVISTLGLTGELCGHSTPDFCAFSEGDWNVIAPQLPSLPTLSFLPGEVLMT